MITHLRPAQPTDAGTVGAILSAFIDDTAWMPRLHSRAEDLSFAGMMIERGWVTLACRGDGVAGFLARDGAMVQALYVGADTQGQGVGSALLRDAQRHCPTLTLWTFQCNSGARRFYARHGFVEAERTDGSGNDEGLPDVRLVWSRADTMAAAPEAVPKGAMQ